MFLPKSQALLNRVVLHCAHDPDAEESCPDDIGVDNEAVCRRLALPGGKSPFVHEIADLIVEGVNLDILCFTERCMHRAALGQIVDVRVELVEEKDQSSDAYLQVALIIPELTRHVQVWSTPKKVKFNIEIEDLKPVIHDDEWGFIEHKGISWRIMCLQEVNEDHEAIEQAIHDKLMLIMHQRLHDPKIRPHLTCSHCVGDKAATEARNHRRQIRFMNEERMRELEQNSHRTEQETDEMKFLQQALEFLPGDMEVRAIQGQKKT